MEKINTSIRVIHLRDYIFLGGTKEALLRNIILTQRLTSCKRGMKSIRKKGYDTHEMSSAQDNNNIQYTEQVLNGSGFAGQVSV